MIERIAEVAAARIEGSPDVVGSTRMTLGYANANYRLETSAGVFLLRHRSGRDHAETEFELDVLDWLRVHRFPSPAAIHFSEGERWLSGPSDSRLVLLEWLDGSQPKSNESNVATIARALGDLHRLPPPKGDWWRRENPIGEEAVSRLMGELDPDGSALDRFFIEAFASQRRQLERLAAPLPRGLIHGDLFPDNTLFRGEELVALLDFEGACEEALLFDVAMTIHGFCFPEEQWTPRLADVFVGAYNERRPLTEAEWEALPSYLNWAPLAMMGWHLQQLLRRPNADNNKRAEELAGRVTTMRKSNWVPERPL